MTMNERRKEIIRLLQNNVTLETNKLVEMFGVSPITIRRDFEFLEKKGLVTTIYGGAMVNRTLQDQTPTENLSEDIVEEKRLIAKTAAGLIRPGQTVLLDAGSTVKELAIELLNKNDITVITNSILVINVLAQATNDVRVISLPGEFRKFSMCFFGAMTMDFLNLIQVDHAFLGVSGFSCERGGTIPDPDEAYVKKKMSQIARNTVVLADRKKIGTDSVYTAVALSDVDMLITGRNDSSKHLADISASGVKVIDVIP
jgi:DeoR/GlpR family transcriptional regulator of sugar metabolism